MAKSQCPKCEADKFEVVEYEPGGSVEKLLFVQCHGCGTIIGVLDYLNYEATMFNLDKRFKRIENKLTNIEYDLDRIVAKRK